MARSAELPDRVIMLLPVNGDEGGEHHERDPEDPPQVALPDDRGEHRDGERHCRARGDHHECLPEASEGIHGGGA
jgi:hypothetical protein